MMWPSLETANKISYLANIALIVSLFIGVVSTGFIVWMGNIKEASWDDSRHQSQERLRLLDAEVEQAHATATIANEAAEAEKVARLNLQAKLAPRRLSANDLGKLISELSDTNVRRITLLRLGDQEASDFASDILLALRGANINADVIDAEMVSPPVYGLQIADTPDYALTKAFSAVGIQVIDIGHSGYAGLRIQVGLKPP